MMTLLVGHQDYDIGRLEDIGSSARESSRDREAWHRQECRRHTSPNAELQQPPPAYLASKIRRPSGATFHRLLAEV
jgi:hypothetical protein